jgi:hypothetical protein
MTDNRATSKARNGVCIPVPSVVERAAAYDQRWSDHAPVTVQYR